MNAISHTIIQIISNIFFILLFTGFLRLAMMCDNITQSEDIRCCEYRYSDTAVHKHLYRVSQDYWDKLYGKLGDIKRIQICMQPMVVETPSFDTRWR